jgi:hypothetical protein
VRRCQYKCVLVTGSRLRVWSRGASGCATACVDATHLRAKLGALQLQAVVPVPLHTLNATSLTYIVTGTMQIQERQTDSC